MARFRHREIAVPRAGIITAMNYAAFGVGDSYEYDAYGNSFTVSGSTPNEFMYRGEQFDSDLGLYYLRARYYNPLTGRFMSRDPNEPRLIGADGMPIDPKILHKYVYANGDPINLDDPMGRASILETGSLNLVIGSAAVPALTEFIGTAAANAALATGISDAAAAIELLAQAGSYEEVVTVLSEAADSILSRPFVIRVLTCAPLTIAYDLAVDAIDDYAREHKWSFIQASGGK